MSVLHIVHWFYSKTYPCLEYDSWLAQNFSLIFHIPFSKQTSCYLSVSIPALTQFSFTSSGFISFTPARKVGWFRIKRKNIARGYGRYFGPFCILKAVSWRILKAEGTSFSPLLGGGDEPFMKNPAQRRRAERKNGSPLPRPTLSIFSPSQRQEFPWTSVQGNISDVALELVAFILGSDIYMNWNLCVK